MRSSPCYTTMDPEQNQQEAALYPRLDSGILSDQSQDFFDELSEFEDCEDFE